MTKFWTVAVAHDPLPQPGDAVEVLRSENGRGYVAWSRGIGMPIEAVTDYSGACRHLVGPEETCGTIGLISRVQDRLAIMRID